MKCTPTCRQETIHHVYTCSLKSQKLIIRQRTKDYQLVDGQDDYTRATDSSASSISIGCPPATMNVGSFYSGLPTETKKQICTLLGTKDPTIVLNYIVSLCWM